MQGKRTPRLRGNGPTGSVSPRWLALLSIGLSVGLAIAPVGCSDDDDPAGPADVTPPAQIDDLSARAAGDGVALLAWTAPGDNGYTGRAERYLLRRHDTVITLATWDSAEVVPGLPVPSPAGARDSVRVTGLRTDWVHHFAIRAIDDAGNEGRLSVDFPFYLPAPDVTPPAAVDDLEAIDVTAHTVRLRWTAPGDDGDAGVAARYQLRYTTGSLTEETWDQADSISVTFAPYPAGQREELLVRELASGTGYEFGLKTVDEAGNLSPLSNTAPARTSD